MGNYEMFRDELFMELTMKMREIPIKQIYSILEIVDCVANSYEVNKMTTDLSIPEEGIPVIVKHFIASKAVERKAPGTIQNYTLMLVNFFKTVRKSVNDITPNDIRVYLYNYKIERKVKPNTIEMMRHILNSFFLWCCAENPGMNNPMLRIGAIKCDTKERDFLEPLELEMIREACNNQREKAMIDFLFSTGCRVSEMCNVLLKDVDFDKRTVFIRLGKGGKSRTTYLNAESIVSLKAYLKTRDNNSPYLFTHTKHMKKQDIGKKAIETIIRNIVARCPQITKKVTPHVIRHTAATTALRNGMPLEQVKEFLGHSNLNTTMIYAKINKEDVKRSHEKYLG